MAVKINDLMRERDSLRKKGVSLSSGEKDKLAVLNAQVKAANESQKKKGCGCSRNKG